MARKGKKSDIKVEQYKEQNQKNEKVFKKTEDYGKKIEALDAAIKENAGVFTRLVDNNPYEIPDILNRRINELSPFFKDKEKKISNIAFTQQNTAAEVGCDIHSFRTGTSHEKVVLRSQELLDNNVLTTLETKYPSDNSGCNEQLRAAKYAPLKHYGKVFLNIDKRYEELLELDKREEDAGEAKTQEKKEAHSRLGNLLKVMQKTLGIDQYSATKTQDKGTQETKVSFLDSLWSIMPGGNTNKVDDKTQAKNTGTGDNTQSTSKAVAIVTVDSKDFEDSIDAGFQKGVDDFYVLAKASCYSKAISAVKTYSSCLIRGKETGGTAGCQKYQFHSEDLLDFCEKSFTYETNTEIEKMIKDQLAEAQKIEYNYDTQKLLTHTDSTLFEAASNQLLQIADAEDVLRAGETISCIGDKCGVQPVGSLSNTEHYDEV